MKQIFVDGKGSLLVKDVPAPACKAGQVLVRVHNSVISGGTETTALKGGGSLIRRAIKEPHLVLNTVKFAMQQGVGATVGAVKDVADSWLTTGYSAAGEVIEVAPDVLGLKVGDRVACAGFGFANHAEFIAVPQNLVAVMPAEVDYQSAAFTTIGAIAMQGVRRCEPTLGETIVVIGTGLIGLLTAQILLANGCQVICTDLAPVRLDKARELGVKHIINAGDTDAVKAVQAITNGAGADGVILTAGTASSAPMNQAFKMCRERGRIVIVGAVGMELERGDFYVKEIDVRMSRSYGPGRHNPLYEEKGYDLPPGYVRWTENRNMLSFMQLIADDKLHIAPLITHRQPIDTAPEAYKAVAQTDEIGVVLQYPNAAKQNLPDTVWHPSVTTKGNHQGKVGIALVGAGNFAKLMHIPNLNKLADKVNATNVITGSGGSARQAAEALNAPNATTDFTGALQDAATQAVLISTRHHLHAEQCIQAANAGKHIFVEKPLGLTLAECQDVLAAVEKNQVLCTIGFNRRFSPVAMTLKNSVSKLNGPKQVLCRVNAGALPATHWLRDPAVGGGRIVGEGCHFFDLMMWFVDSDPVSVSATALNNDLDELTATVTYADGSTGTMIYTGHGSSSYPKEYIEVIGGGGIGVLDDFKSVTLSGLSGKSQSLRKQDKGHAALLENFVDAIQGNAPLLVTAKDGLLATATAVAALESAQTGQRVLIQH